LAPLCSVESAGEHTLWLLRRDRRVAVLKRLVNAEVVQQKLAQSLPPSDRFGEMVRNILKRGAAIEIEELSREDMLAVAAALEALDGLDLPTPDAAKLKQLLSRTEFLTDYEVLLEKGFFGREKELARLEALLDDNVSARKVVLLSGPGGAGKSTLL